MCLTWLLTPVPAVSPPCTSPILLRRDAPLNFDLLLSGLSLDLVKKERGGGTSRPQTLQASHWCSSVFNTNIKGLCGQCVFGMWSWGRREKDTYKCQRITLLDTVHLKFSSTHTLLRIWFHFIPNTSLIPFYCIMMVSMKSHSADVTRSSITNSL